MPSPPGKTRRACLQGRDGLERERRLRQRPSGYPQQQQRIVVADGTVEAQVTAAGATMNQNPFAVAAHADSDRLHRGTALSRPIPRTPIQVTAPQAVGAVVAMRCSWRVQGYVESAAFTAERACSPATRASALIVWQG